MEDDITFQSLPPLKRLRLLQQRHLHDNKENFDSSFQLPAKKRKESRSSQLLPQSGCTTFPLPAKKRVSAYNPDLFSGNPFSPFDLNVEYKPILSFESPISVAPNLFDEIPKPVKEDKIVESPISIVSNLFDEVPQPVKEDKIVESPISIAPNPFVETPRLVEVNDCLPSIVPNLFVESPQPAKDKGILVEEDEEGDVEDEEDGIVCAICQSTDGDPTDPIVFCDGCDLMVHTTCYGNPLVTGVPDGDWFCAQCLAEKKPDKGFSCCLCPTKGGAMKPTTKDGLWAHIVCAVYVPEVFFEDPDGREGINCCEIPKWRRQDKCYICKTRKGCAIRCSEPKCGLGFHVTCGLNQDLCIEYKQEKKTDEIIVAGFCKTHSELWKKQQQTGKFKIVASKEHNK